MTEPNDTDRLLEELADFIQQTLTAASQTEEPAPELAEVVDGGMRRILASHPIDDHALERVRETRGTFEAGAAGWGRAVKLAEERYDGEW
jgi:hypothetical protein